MQTPMQQLIIDIEIVKKHGIISYYSANEVLDTIQNIYLEEEKNQMLNLIHFVRLNDKMGKSIEDLYNEFYETI